MPNNSRSRRLTRVLSARVIASASIALLLLNPARSLAYAFEPSQYPADQDPGQFPDFPVFGPDFGNDATMPRRGSRSKGSRKKARAPEKGTAKKTDSAAKPASPAVQRKADAAPGELVFSQDIAPILVANCVRCHSGDGAGVRRGKLDLSTFEKLQKGTPDEKVIIPGKPEESHLVLRIKGEEDPRMPQGNNNVLSQDAIAKIEKWVKQGAKPDARVELKAAMESYAASPDQMRKRQVAKLPAGERDKAIEAKGRERWRQANPKLNPEITTTDRDHFVIFSNLAKEKASTVLRAMEAQYGHMRRLLGTAATDWPEKLSLYVFATKKDFIEFVRTVENRDLEADEVTTAKLMVPQPYVAVQDPSGGKKEEPSARRRVRGKRGDAKESESSASDRTLIGLLTESVDAATVAAAGNPPRWLAKGIGSYYASHVERSPYYNQLRQAALANFDQGWATKATEALGGAEQIAPGDLHAVGFAFVEGMISTELRSRFPAFVHGLLQGPAKLDDVLKEVYDGATREDFINDIGNWMVTRYREGQVQ
jgi:cytochrome c553